MRRTFITSGCFVGWDFAGVEGGGREGEPQGQGSLQLPEEQSLRRAIISTFRFFDINFKTCNSGRSRTQPAGKRLITSVSFVFRKRRPTSSCDEIMIDLILRHLVCVWVFSYKRRTTWDHKKTWPIIKRTWIIVVTIIIMIIMATTKLLTLVALILHCPGKLKRLFHCIIKQKKGF